MLARLHFRTKTDEQIAARAEEVWGQNPSCSIALMARLMVSQFGHAITYNELKRVRASVWQSLSASGGWRDIPEEKRPNHLKQFGNHPHGSTVTVLPIHGASRAALACQGERRAWFSDWAAEHPSATATEARKAIQARFGVGVGQGYINETMRVAKQLAQAAAAASEQASPELELAHAFLRSGAVSMVRVAEGVVVVTEGGTARLLAIRGAGA